MRRELRLNGMGVLKRAIFFKVYVVGFYLEMPTKDARVGMARSDLMRKTSNSR